MRACLQPVLPIRFTLQGEYPAEKSDYLSFFREWKEWREPKATLIWRIPGRMGAVRFIEWMNGWKCRRCYGTPSGAHQPVDATASPRNV